ncbi:MAG: AlbA family DNA-binding domain-containing protein [Candidatus Bathyarchaeia archaeon]|jgi:hypothetical protein
MQLKLYGNIQLPKNLNEMIASIPPLTDTTAPELPYISSFKNKIDPVLLCTFYGLYKSRELPSKFDATDFTAKRDFNVNISEAAELLSHLLFCLWVKQNGYPDTCKDQVKYRKDLYDFIENLLDEHYYRNTIIPFYISKASIEEGGTSSFLHRLTSSSNVKLELTDYSPEYLALDFANAQRDFIDEVVKPTLDNQPKPNISKLSELLVKDESDTLEFKASLRYNKNNKAITKNGVEPADPQLEKTALATISAFLNSEGGTLVIGIEDRTKNVLGLKNDYKTFSDERKRDRDGFENHLRNLIIDNIVPYIPKLVKIEFEKIGDEEVCVVTVQKSTEKPMFLNMKGGDKNEFWIRDGNGKRHIDGADMFNYIRKYWPDYK